MTSPATGHRGFPLLCVLAPEDCRRFAFEDGTVVFNPASWQSHLLNPSATRIFNALFSGPCSRDDLARLFDEHDAAEIAGTVDEMESLGLVGRIEPSA
ncbi:MAG: HPr-rel-A system PqqD family peptide chaperone [Burkholderiales bacterium]